MNGSLQGDRVYVTVDILVLLAREGQLYLMLSRRTDPPYKGSLALPGRFVALDESAEAAVRCLMDEMFPAPDPFLEQLYTFSEVNRDPRGRVISSAYLVIVPWREAEELISRGETPMRPYRACLKAGTLELTGEDGRVLTGSDLAFDHGRIIETGLTRLQGKIDYSDIGFYVLARKDLFSLSELQAVHEAVLGVSLDSSNFRRAILGRYQKNGRLRQTVQEEKKGRGRPAVLYRYDG